PLKRGLRKPRLSVSRRSTSHHADRQTVNRLSRATKHINSTTLQFAGFQYVSRWSVVCQSAHGGFMPVIEETTVGGIEDSVRVYRGQMGGGPLLTPAREVDLARGMDKPGEQVIRPSSGPRPVA